ncbi:carbon-nitrogen family hydrolase [Staphylococcus chromogenes]|uniref:carbon-nitrogen family hydrolase n=1 Tax=Staphylococcus chromogenes TaxID=46126 RepID=UPI000D1BCED1|nr:carbon-nitrogen family hydrolase [Staphylococcus chromogenes]PTG12204.1 carbon-nitrogen family hydrolase [Staphylococcus chromogenes]
MKVQLLQFYVTPQSPSINEEKIKSLFREHIHSDTDIVVLPEMWNNGYALEALATHADQDLSRSFTLIRELAVEYQVDIVAGSVSNHHDKGLYNTAFAVSRNGAKLYEYDKIHLVPMLNEPDYLDPGSTVPYVYELSNGTPVSQIICYDLRFPELTRYPAASGAKILFYVAQWPKARQDHWRKLLQARAIENDMYVIASNTCGNDGNTEYAGHSMIVSPNGEIIEESGNEEIILSTTLNLKDVDEQRKKIPVFENLRPDIYRHFEH